MSWIDGLASESRASRSFRFWNLSSVNGAFDWEAGLSTSFYLALWTCILLIVAFPALYAVLRGSTTTGILNIISCAIFFLGGGAHNRYVHARHRYAEDMLRVSLPTSHHEGTVYVLPSSNRGFDAVWTPKVANEHLEADNEAMTLFRNMRSGRWSPKEPLERLRTILARYHQRLRIEPDDVAALARWLYRDLSANPVMSRIQCQRAPNVHLIGRDLIYALCHAEYIVFMGQGQISRELQEKLSTLRLMSRSGAARVGKEEVQTIGFRRGYDGYREAVRYVYSLFDQDVDESALNFANTPPPRYSSAIAGKSETIDQYVDELWSLCLEHTESTFTALYMFTTVWFIEMGNTNGFHIFPLRCLNRNGDLISQQIVWRQAWYCCIIAQLVAVSPAFYTAFVAGYLQ